MITISGILLNTLWIAGLAGVLATVSYTDWLRHTRPPGQDTSWKFALQTAEFSAPFNLSMFFTSVGIGASGWYGTPSQPIWQTILWFILALLFVIQFFAYFKREQ